MSAVHCLFGGCRTGRSLSGAMSQVTQKEARGAAPAAAAAAAAAAAIVAPLPPATVRPRGGVEPLPLPRTPRRRAQHPGGPRSRQACAHAYALSPRSQVPHRRKRQPAARTARAIALGGVFGQAVKRPPRPLVSCVAARSLVSGGGAGRVCRATLQQQPRCARNQHACCLPSHRAVARRPPPPAFRRSPPDAEACSFSIAAKQERHLANDAP